MILTPGDFISVRFYMISNYVENQLYLLNDHCYMNNFSAKTK